MRFVFSHFKTPTRKMKAEKTDHQSERTEKLTSTLKPSCVILQRENEIKGACERIYFNQTDREQGGLLGGGTSSGCEALVKEMRRFSYIFSLQAVISCQLKDSSEDELQSCRNQNLQNLQRSFITLYFNK